MRKTGPTFPIELFGAYTTALKTDMFANVCVDASNPIPSVAPFDDPIVTEKKYLRVDLYDVDRAPPSDVLLCVAIRSSVESVTLDDAISSVVNGPPIGGAGGGVVSDVTLH